MELNEQCARALGWEPYHTDGVDYYRVSPHAIMPANLFDPSTDIESARMLEDEIERRGLQEPYVYALGKIIGMRDINDWLEAEDWWRFLRATPEQRARAFLEAVGHAET